MSWKYRNSEMGPKPEPETEPRRKMAGIHYKGFKRDLIITIGLIALLFILKAMGS